MKELGTRVASRQGLIICTFGSSQRLYFTPNVVSLGYRAFSREVLWSDVCLKRPLAAVCRRAAADQGRKQGGQAAERCCHGPAQKQGWGSAFSGVGGGERVLRT